MSKLLQDLTEISKWGDDKPYSNGFRDGVKTAIKRIEMDGVEKCSDPENCKNNKMYSDCRVCFICETVTI